MESRRTIAVRLAAFATVAAAATMAAPGLRAAAAIVGAVAAMASTLSGPRGRWSAWGPGRFVLAAAQVLVAFVYVDGQVPGLILLSRPGLLTAIIATLAGVTLVVALILVGRYVDASTHHSVDVDAAIVTATLFAGLWAIGSGHRSLGGAQIPAGPWVVVGLALTAAATGALFRSAVASNDHRRGVAFLAVGIVAYEAALLAEGLWHAGGAVGARGDVSSGLVFALLCTFLWGSATGSRQRVVHDPTRPPADPTDVSLPRFVVVAVGALSVPVSEVVQSHEHGVVVETVAVVTCTLVLVRMWMLLQTVSDSRRRLLRDPLTGLSNRTLFADRAEHVLRQRGHTELAVMFIDLDDFKTVNDSLGHQAGDDLLTTVAARLVECVRDGDTVARLGGDEFGVMLEGIGDRELVAAKARRILEAVSRPMNLRDHVVQVAASIGIALRGDETNDAETLLRGADLAMYLAKSQGKGRYEFFDRSMHEAVVDRLNLKNALARGELALHYQPIIDVAEQRLESVEALLRWHHPVRGLVPPDVFIPLAEETGLIVPIGRWALGEACRQARQWQQLGPEIAELGMGVNLSVYQMHDPGLVPDIAAALADSGLAPHHLCMELTESILMEDAEHGASRLREMKGLGVKIAIDDFGTGYSSLGYLKNFPVDLIKIDRSFVSELCDSEKSELLVRTVVDLTAALGAAAIAEGIEDYDQFERLHHLGCTYGQGYLISRPLTAASMSTLLAASIETRVFDIHPRDRDGNLLVPDRPRAEAAPARAGDSGSSGSAAGGPGPAPVDAVPVAAGPTRSLWRRR